jgi:hypothetical protein
VGQGDRSRAILDSINNIMNNSNNTNSTSHDNGTLTTTNNTINNSNNLITNTTTSENNSGDSNCKNTHNINFNIHFYVLNLRPGLTLHKYGALFASQTIMDLVSYQQQSLGMYHGYYCQGQGQ